MTADSGMVKMFAATFESCYANFMIPEGSKIVAGGKRAQRVPPPVAYREQEFPAAIWRLRRQIAAGNRAVFYYVSGGGEVLAWSSQFLPPATIFNRSAVTKSKCPTL